MTCGLSAIWAIATTRQPATDLGYLLHKHPDRVHQIELAFAVLALESEPIDPRL
jgi:hypothetical protein